MSTMKNSVMLIGSPTTPEIIDGKNHTKKAVFRIKVIERKKNENNEWVCYTNVFDCIGENAVAERIAREVKSGKRIAIDGSLRSVEWNDDKGIRHNEVKVVVRDLFNIDYNDED